MNNVKSNNSNNIPLIIIGAVLLAAIGGGWWLYSSSSTPSKPAVVNKTPSKSSPTPDSRELYANAPAGAQPANMLGAPNATVTVEEFADYQCPTCAVVHPKMQEITKIYGNRIKFIYRNFPLQQMHAHAYEAAVAAEAASLQGKFWDMQSQLFLNQKEWSNSSEVPKLFEGYARKIGLDVPRYQSDVLGLGTKARVDADMKRGRAIGVAGTPAVYINGKEISFEKFTVESLQQIIDAELQNPAGQTSNQTTTANQSNNVANTANDNGGAKSNVGNSIEKK